MSDKFIDVQLYRVYRVIRHRQTKLRQILLSICKIPVCLNQFFQVFSVSIFVHIFTWTINVRSNGVAVLPRFVVDIVFVIMSETTVHAFTGIEEALIELCLTRTGNTLGRQTKGDLFADIALSFALQTRSLVRSGTSQITFTSAIFMSFLSQLVSFAWFFGLIWEKKNIIFINPIFTALGDLPSFLSLSAPTSSPIARAFRQPRELFYPRYTGPLRVWQTFHWYGPVASLGRPRQDVYPTESCNPEIKRFFSEKTSFLIKKMKHAAYLAYCYTILSFVNNIII